MKLKYSISSLFTLRHNYSQAIDRTRSDVEHLITGCIITGCITVCLADIVGVRYEDRKLGFIQFFPSKFLSYHFFTKTMLDDYVKKTS